MAAILFFDSINLAEVPRGQIYRRLGYRRGLTGLSPREREETEGAIDRARSFIRLQGAARRLPIRKEGDGKIILPDGTIFESRQLFKFIGVCNEVLLMGATAGSSIVQEIQADTEGRNATRGVILDAAASEITDAALDWIAGYFGAMLRRERKRLLPARYSAGYGDLPLDNQRSMHRLLALDKIGVSITQSFILIPEKSVTAITGILDG